MNNEKCFLCDKPLKKLRYLVDTHEDQKVFVGPNCFKKIKASAGDGYGGRTWKPGYVKCYLIENKS